MGISLRWGARATAGVHDMQRARARSSHAKHGTTEEAAPRLCAAAPPGTAGPA